MESLKELLKNIDELKLKYDKEREKYRFNMISALYKAEEEKLHSRLISYLLSPESGHGMNHFFLKIFVRGVLQLQIEDFDLNGCEVIPNEINKKEFEYIDILIVNKARKQAIIIENKINARDSNRKKEEIEEEFNTGDTYCYDGQLERYYSTLKTGKNKNGFDINPYLKCNTVFVFYLKDSCQEDDIKDSLGILLNEEHKNSWKGIISYENHIREWLNTCIGEIHSDKILVKEFVQQYLNLINKMTHNDIPTEERIKLKNIVATEIESSKYLMENFKHVKWHTAHEFWVELKSKMEQCYENVSFYPKENIEFDKIIEEITRKNKELNYGILFFLKDGTKAYISGQGNLSWGILEPEKKWSDFESQYIENINFSEFSSDNTFRLIDEEKMKEAVELIVKEIVNEENKNFENLQTLTF